MELNGKGSIHMATERSDASVEGLLLASSCHGLLRRAQIRTVEDLLEYSRQRGVGGPLDTITTIDFAERPTLPCNVRLDLFMEDETAPGRSW